LLAILAVSVVGIFNVVCPWSFSDVVMILGRAGISGALFAEKSAEKPEVTTSYNYYSHLVMYGHAINPHETNGAWFG
jgi:hypothetical protein